MGTARTNRALLGLAAASAVGCQGSTNVSFAGALVFSVTGTGVTATVPSPCEVDVDFGVVPVGQASIEMIQIRNQTTRTVTFGAFTLVVPLDFFMSPTALAPLAAGASTQLSVSFAPTKSGAVLSSFSIPTRSPASACGSSSSTILVKLSGEGAQLSLAVAPTALDFGTVLLGESSVETVTLTNRSSLPASGLSAAVTGTDASMFTVGSFTPTLAAGASAAVQLSYSPVALEKQSDATLTFSGAGGESAALHVSGKPVGVALSAVPDPNFGYVPLGTTAIACTTVSNAANVAVTIFTIADFEPDGVYGISDVDGSSPPKSTELPTEVPGHGSVEVCFTFTPLGAMQYTGQLTLQTNDPSGENPVLQLTGWGGGPQITCSPISLNFGSIEAFTSKTLPVFCTNTGSRRPMDGNLLIEPPTAGPAVFEAQFDQTIDPYPLGGLDPGESAQIDVSYNPTSTTADDGSVVIRNNGGQFQPVVIAVSGQGLPLGQCQLAIDPTTLNFGSVAVGEMSAPR